MGDSSLSTLTALKDLLASPTEEEDGRQQQTQATTATAPAHATPGSIGASGDASSTAPAPVTRKSKKEQQLRQERKEKLTNSKDIWTEEEVQSEEHNTLEEDDRPEPNYTLRFKQAVTSEDMYLGMSGRNPSSHSCNEIMVLIDLPNTNVKHVDLQVKRESLNVLTPTHRLNLTLPHPVDDKKGAAQWIADKQQLRVALPVQRDYEFLLE